VRRPWQARSGVPADARVPTQGDGLCVHGGRGHRVAAAPVPRNAAAAQRPAQAPARLLSQAQGRRARARAPLTAPGAAEGSPRRTCPGRLLQRAAVCASGAVCWAIV